MADLSIIILTRDEKIHLPRVLASVAGLAREVIIVDSFSTDGTVEIARAHGATVYQNKFINYSKQFQWALENAQVSGSWVMRLDADEVIESDLRAELERVLPAQPADVTGINLKRKHIFLGRWVRHGGRYPLILLRIWRKGLVRIEDRWMDEHMILTSGRAITLHGGFADHNLNDLTFFTEKHNRYATREAIDIINQRLDLFPRDQALNAGNTSGQTAVKRWMKEKFYNRIPFHLSTTAYFLYRYFIQLGFLDGREGLTYHFLQGYWYRFLVGAKVMELERALAACDGKSAKLKELGRLTGHALPGA